jgi:hypothetical protein
MSADRFKLPIGRPSLSCFTVEEQRSPESRTTVKRPNNDPGATEQERREEPYRFSPDGSEGWFSYETRREKRVFGLFIAGAILGLIGIVAIVLTLVYWSGAFG